MLISSSPDGAGPLGRLRRALAGVSIGLCLVVLGSCSSSGGEGAAPSTDGPTATGGATTVAVKDAGAAAKKDDTVTIPSDLLFGFDSAELSADAEGLLAGALELTRRLPKASITVDGHTDSIGNPAYNRDLSRRRASRVAGWLQTHGVDPSRMTVRGFGAEQPIADNSTPEGRQMNRRVEIAVGSKN